MGPRLGQEGDPGSGEGIKLGQQRGVEGRVKTGFELYSELGLLVTCSIGIFSVSI